MRISLHWGGLALAGAVIALIGGPEEAEAHICLDYPMSRVGAECVVRSPQKIGPCGIEGRSEIINVFRPGETIEVRWRETVDHPSHYRIGFNPEGDFFPDPVAIDDIKNDHPLILLDGIEDLDESVQTAQVTLPDIECEACTLQLIQVMYDKQQNGFGGRTVEGGNDDMYYSCADIALRAEPAAAMSTGQGRVPALTGLGLLAVAGLMIGRRRFR